MRDEKRKARLEEERERLNRIYRRNVKLYIMTLVFVTFVLLLAKRLNPNVDIANPLKVLLALMGGWVMVLFLSFLRRRR
ncbi:MAG: hypothetical protein H5T91_06485 [Synergistetes bacterium]|nr:hypothetical protein [Synergistota bacterium]MDK2872176.1 hypothetical protein [bacterium]